MVDKKKVVPIDGKDFNRSDRDKIIEMGSNLSSRRKPRKDPSQIEDSNIILGKQNPEMLIKKL